MAVDKRVAAIFLMEKSIIPTLAKPIKGLEICKSCEEITGKNTIDGAQKISGLWRIYPLGSRARRDLLVSGIEIRGQSLVLLDKNPFMVAGADNPTTKLIVGNIPISVSNTEITDSLRNLGAKLRSPLKEEYYRDDDGGLTRFKTGRRFVYIDIPVNPLPKLVRVASNFVAFLYYREQEMSKERHENKERQNAPEEGNEDPHAAPAEELSTADADDSNHTKETTVSELSESEAGVTHPNAHSNSLKQATERARAIISKKQTTLDMFKSGGRRARSADGRHKRFLSSGLAGMEKKQRRDGGVEGTSADLGEQVEGDKSQRSSSVANFDWYESDLGDS
ncbi:hypothetical protein ElyMa_004706000 [Elysia marginata]|uniref:Uncharacterized protein n=1 Tax=Elysia marginata TaxID=1093978 RepID=A0AAV4IB83_9GAST|nr:hypothetical protein ElyMa_004706000 [Elysia marginata]